MDFSELWRWNGRVERREYALVGIHRIHLRVLEHIKNEVESNTSS